ncbi:MAG: hypothetical protein IKX62_00010 [Bacteroidales bacterium]|nr:hypothetical protein [Bacteroidales bacterium]
MRRKFLPFLLLLAAAWALPARAGGPLAGLLDPDRYTFGVEWGYTQTFFLARSYNFFSEEGYRIFEDDKGFLFTPNATLLAHFGFHLNERVTLSLATGYFGVGENNRLLPALVRLNFYPATHSEDGWFAFAQGGPAWHEREVFGAQAWLCSGGGGYRLHLAYRCNLDLLIGVKYLHDHPSIPNPEGPGNVPEYNIRRNDAGYCALDVSVAVSF